MWYYPTSLLKYFKIYNCTVVELEERSASNYNLLQKVWRKIGVKYANQSILSSLADVKNNNKMPPKRRGRPSPAQKSSVDNVTKEGISVGLVTDEEEEENALGGARLEFVPIEMNDDGNGEGSGADGKIIFDLKIIIKKLYMYI